jgi:hypothetical protein
MIRGVVEENARRLGANIDLDDATAQLEFQCWKLYLDWDPEGLPFESYAFGLLRRRAFDYYRELLGRNGEKLLSRAISLTYTEDGEERERAALAADNVDPSSDLMAVLGRVEVAAPPTPHAADVNWRALTGAGVSCSRSSGCAWRVVARARRSRAT